MLKTIDQERVDQASAALAAFAEQTSRPPLDQLLEEDHQDLLCDLLTALHTYADTAPGLDWEEATERSARYYPARAKLRLP